jgi:hypothetical protein
MEYATICNYMIHYNDSTNTYSFDLPNHNTYKGSKLTYNQLFVDDKLHLLNINTGDLSTNTIDLSAVPLLKLYNFGLDGGGRFRTQLNEKTTYIHELICNLKTNNNWVINHIDGNCTNNQRANLELVTNWFNSALKKTTNSLPLGVNHDNGNSFVIRIRLPTIQQQINFGSKSIDYLQNIHYQFGTKSGLVSPQRYLEATLNWLPDNSMIFKPKHQEKIDMLVKEHLENQAKWDKPESIY